MIDFNAWWWILKLPKLILSQVFKTYVYNVSTRFIKKCIFVYTVHTYIETLRFINVMCNIGDYMRRGCQVDRLPSWTVAWSTTFWVTRNLCLQPKTFVTNEVFFFSEIRFFCLSLFFLCKISVFKSCRVTSKKKKVLILRWNATGSIYGVVETWFRYHVCNNPQYDFSLIRVKYPWGLSVLILRVG